MLNETKLILQKYVNELVNIYGRHLQTVILYGSYARGDYNADSDIDIMILLDLKEEDVKEYRHKLSDLTFDYNMDFEVDIKPLAKSKEHFEKWIKAYPFYSNIDKEGVKLFDVA